MIYFWFFVGDVFLIFWLNRVPEFTLLLQVRLSRPVAILRVWPVALIVLTCSTCLFNQSAHAHQIVQHRASLSGQAKTTDERARGNKLVSFPVISGIGAALSITSVGPRIAKVIPNSAAAQSGKLHKGDLILSIRENGRTIRLKGKTMGEVVSFIRGPVGTSITLRVKPANGGPDFIVALTREAVPLPGISYENLVGRSVPDVIFTKLGQSSPVTLSRFRGKIVVLDLWASWCGACYAPLDEMQKIAQAHHEWKGHVILLAATIDINVSAALEVIQKRGWDEMTFLSLSLRGMKSMHVETIPTLLVISPSGEIVAAGDPHAISIEKQVSRLL